MAKVIFYHPRVIPNQLAISVRPDQVTWAYGLNTAVYPTYGGEVVQILSVFFDDMTIAGTVGSYAEMERIYQWFIAYMQAASQGTSNIPSHDQVPVSFYYPERNWHFQIWPKSLPGFKYGRDVVAPTWKVVAAVKEPDATFADQLKTVAQSNAANGTLATFGKATADFGDTGNLTSNPFASPDANPLKKGQTFGQFLSQQTKQLADTFSGFVQSYATDSFTQLPEFADFSKPPNLTADGSTKSKTGKKSKKTS